MIDLVQEINDATKEKRYSCFKDLFCSFDRLLQDLRFRENWEKFKLSKVNNLQFQFLTIYCNMVRRLMEFIQASRTRNWLQHLSAGEALLKDFVAMDRINYRKGMLVYLADMKNLEHCYPLVWKYFEEGNFSVQKTPIPGVGIGCDHAGEQVNCEDKSRGGLKGITKNENARIRHYLVAPVLEQIS